MCTEITNDGIKEKASKHHIMYLVINSSTCERNVKTFKLACVRLYNNVKLACVRLYNNVKLSPFSFNANILFQSQEYSIDIYLRQQWEDPRLEYDNWTSLARLELDNKVMDKVWTPDTFFVNEKHAFVHNVTIPNKLMHIHRNGTVLYSMR